MELQDRVAKARESSEELIKVRKEIVDFHGEMVLLENYNSLNYTGLVKILKKYVKRIGALIRLPFIQKVLRQSFFIIDLLQKLVKECASMLDRLFPESEPGNACQSSSSRHTRCHVLSCPPTDAKPQNERAEPKSSKQAE